MNTLQHDDAVDRLPDDARIWIYATDRELNEREENRVVEILMDFCGSWESHRRPVESAAGMIEGRFAYVAASIASGEVSGCGIDKSVRALEKAASELAFEWQPGLLVHYRDENGVVRSVARSDFRELVQSGSVTADTPVFDLTIESLGQLRKGNLERPAARTWHARAFKIPQEA